MKVRYVLIPIMLCFGYLFLLHAVPASVHAWLIMPLYPLFALVLAPVAFWVVLGGMLYIVLTWGTD